MTSPAFAAWMAATPLWLVTLSLVIAMVLSGTAGSLLRAQVLRRHGGDHEHADSDGGFMLSSVLGLLALLLGFTFALAADRFEARRGMVLEEANAIGTTYLRTQLLEEPHRSRISQLLVQYTDNRVEIAKLPGPEARRLFRHNNQLAKQLWEETVAAWPTIRGMDFSSSYIDSMNTLLEFNEARKTSRLTKVPPAVHFVLFIYLIVTAGMVGYTRKSLRERISSMFLFLLLTLTLMLIVDIDRPVDGRINESQQPMEDIQAMLRAAPPASFSTPPAAAP